MEMGKDKLIAAGLQPSDNRESALIETPVPETLWLSRLRYERFGGGPSLTALGVPGALADPTLELHDSTSTLAMNDNWRSDQQAEIEATGLAPTDNLEAAIVRTLPANNASYTAIVREKNNTTGIGVVEAYDLDTASTLPPGNYTAVVRGKNNTIGIAVVEVYNIP